MDATHPKAKIMDLKSTKSLVGNLLAHCAELWETVCLVSMWSNMVQPHTVHILFSRMQTLDTRIEIA